MKKSTPKSSGISMTRQRHMVSAHVDGRASKLKFEYLHLQLSDVANARKKYQHGAVLHNLMLLDESSAR
jgi:hypothetical protein